MFAQNITRLLGFKDKFIIIFGCFSSNPGLGELLMNYFIHYSLPYQNQTHEQVNWFYLHTGVIKDMNYALHFGLVVYNQRLDYSYIIIQYFSYVIVNQCLKYFVTAYCLYCLVIVRSSNVIHFKAKMEQEL